MEQTVSIDELVSKVFCIGKLVDLEKLGSLSIEELEDQRVFLGKLEGQKSPNCKAGNIK